MTASFSRMFGIGCGDNSCIWGARGGMGTNGGCRCYDRTASLTAQQREERLLVSSGIRLLRELADLPQVEAALFALVRATDRSEP